MAIGPPRRGVQDHEMYGFRRSEQAIFGACSGRSATSPVERARGISSGPMSPSPAIELHGVTKRFGAYVAVDGLDLTIPTGGIYGLLGPNGSGKTTTIRMIMGIFL